MNYNIVKDAKFNKFVCDFYNQFNKLNYEYSDFVFLCIGTDRMTGDCFGPLVGSKIKQKIQEINTNYVVYGDLDNPLIYSNIDKKLNEIKKIYKKPCIIAIDAALSKENNIGKILVKSGGVKSGEAINKKSGEIGHMSIKAIIGKNYNKTDKNMELLQNTSLNFVLGLANIVSTGILEIINYKINEMESSKLSLLYIR